MTWFGWLMVSLEAVASLITVLLIGKPRQVITNGVAAFTVGVSVALAIGILTVGTGHL